MGYLIHILVALLGQGMAEAGWSTGWRVPGLALLALPVPYALAWSGHRLFLRGRFRTSAVFLRASAVSPPVLHLLVVCVFGWMESLRAWFGVGASLGEWPRAGLLLALLPFVAFELAAIDARARVGSLAGTERRAWRGFHTRMLLSGLAPLVAYVLISSAAGASDTVRIEIEEVSLFAAAFAAVLLLALVFSLPLLLRNVWNTAPFPPGERLDVLRAVADRARFKARALLAWNTGDLMANAAIVGIGPRSRIVLFSDSLLAQLDTSELAAVFAHEIGHAARRHVLIFVTWAGAFFLFADLAANRLFASDSWLGGGFVLGAVLAWLLAFGFASRRFELEADLYCLDLLGDPAALIRALEKVGGRFRDVASWRHFSTAERVSFLERAAIDPSVGQKLRSGLRRWNRVGVGLLLVAVSLQTWTLAHAFAGERLRADLRLGSYAAAARARSSAGVDPRLAALAARAATLPAGAGLVDLEREARSAMLHGDVEASLDWLDLGALRGSSDLEAVADALRGLLEKNVDPREALEAGLAAKWGGEIDAAKAAVQARRGAGG